MALEAFGDLFGEGHFLGLSKEGCNNQQCLELAFGWLVLEAAEVSRRWFGAA